MGKKIDIDIFINAGKKGAASTLKSQGPKHYSKISKKYWDSKKKNEEKNNS